MDGNQFDQLTKTMAASTSRRRALGALTASGLLGAFGLGRAAAAQGSTCTLDFVTTIRSGPTSGQPLTNDATTPGEARGELSFGLSSSGALENGSLLLTDGTSLPVVGQATGNSLHFRAEAGQGLVLVGIGVGEQEIAACQGAVDGLMTGPQPGDLGDWHAVATGQASSTGGQQPARAAAAGPVLSGGGRSTGSGATGTSRLTSCPAGQTICTGRCVDVSSDRENCGECGRICASEAPLICVEGECVSDPDGECAPGTDRCGDDGCRDLSQDIDHCGECFNACLDGFNCIDGTCNSENPPAQACEQGFTECGGVCIDTDNDADNCGACGNVCQVFPTIFDCVAGVCVPPDCGDGLTDCSGLCDNLQTSTINCGTCGAACGVGEVCTAGVCAIAGGGGCKDGSLTRCPTGPGAQDFVCVNVQADIANCGACGNACAPGSTCQGGQCFAAEPLVCNPGLENCFGVCTDTSNDNANCGACGVPCAAGLVCQGRICLAGGPACGAGQVVCQGTCTFVETDFFNCGACGNVCAEGQNCAGSQCVAPVV